MARLNEFSRVTQQHALVRQKYRCASCGTPVLQLGDAAQVEHRFGEGVQAHHVQHIKFAGSDAVDNCVILCKSCHYSTHEGGNYRYGSVVGRESDYPHFRG